MRQIFESIAANRRANQPQGRVVNRSRHAPHLAVAAFTNPLFYPCRQDGVDALARAALVPTGRAGHPEDRHWLAAWVFLELHTAPATQAAPHCPARLLPAPNRFGAN